MIYNVVLNYRDNKYTARVREWPDLIVEEKTREAAIQAIRSRLAEYLTGHEVVQIQVPLPPKTTGNPWIDKFGWFKDDPTFDDLQTEIAAYRAELDQSVEKPNISQV